MMTICWKYLVPMVFVLTFLILGWMIILPWESTASWVIRIIMTLAGAGLAVEYVRRIRYNLRQAKVEIDLNVIV